jgi:hypothetical protein
MSITPAFNFSVSRLAVLLVALGIGSFYGLSAARADSQSCEKQIVAVAQVANQQTDSEKKDKALKYLAKAKDELVQEGDEEDCLSEVEKAKSLLGL